MGTISSGVGLVSGLDIENIVSQLIKIESQPITRLGERVTATQERQAAYMELSALLLGAKGLIHTFVLPSAFKVKTASSSNESVLTAAAKTTASAGTYGFLVKSLAASHQVVSSGFADVDRTPVLPGKSGPEDVGFHTERVQRDSARDDPHHRSKRRLCRRRSAGRDERQRHP